MVNLLKIGKRKQKNFFNQLKNPISRDRGRFSMNKTFKVVFNRTRGALMVANEITSSIQKKGTKTVLAAALISALA